MEHEIKALVNRYQGGGYLEIHLETREFTTIEYSGSELETLTRSELFVGNIRLFEKGFWYFTSFMDRDFDKHYDRILKMLLVGEAREGAINSYQKINTQIKTPFQIDSRLVPLEEKYSLVKRYNEIILNSKNIQTSRAIYKDIARKKYFANTEGSYIEQEKLFTGVSCAAVARSGMNIQTASYSHAGHGGYELVTGKEAEVEKTVSQALEMLNAPQVEGGRYNVILDNQMSGVFAHEAFGHLSEADFIYENPEMQEMMKLGREFGREIVNIVDDGTIEGLAGYVPFDDEGVNGRRTELIKSGKLNARLHSRETAIKMGETVTGNARALNPFFAPQVRMTNTFIDNGTTPVSELFEACGDGIYACGFIGGMTSLEQFTFTPRCAYIVKNGKIVSPVRDTVLSGNVFETIKNITHTGNDLKHFGTLGGCGKGGQNGLTVTTGGPHILVENVLVGGKK